MDPNTPPANINLGYDRRVVRYGPSNPTIAVDWPSLGRKSANLLNVSEGGVALSAEDPVPLGAVLRLSASGISVKGTVAWCTRAYPAHSYSIGVVISEPRPQREMFVKAIGTLEQIPDRRIAPDWISRSDGRRFEDLLRQFDVLAPSQQVVYRRKGGDRRSSQIHHQGRKRGPDRRAHAIAPPPLPPASIRGLEKVLLCIRDLLILLTPTWITQRLFRDASFAFVTHPRDLEDIARHFPFARWIPKKLLAIWLKYQWPVIGASIVNYPIRGKGIQKGWLIFCPLTAKQMIRNREFATKRVVTAVRFAEKVNAKIVGLGAFTSIVTRDGYDLMGKVNIGITTGNALSAAIAIQNGIKAAELTGRKLAEVNVGIVGAAGNVGSACARVLSRNCNLLRLIDINRRGLDKLSDELGSDSSIQLSTDIASIKDCDLVIVVTNTPGAIVKAHHLKVGAIAIDCAQPKNVSEQVPLERPDVIVIESAVLKLPKMECQFDLGIGANEALGCMAETIVLDAVGWHRDFSVGRLTTAHVKKILSAARMVGADISYFRHSRGFVTEDSIDQVKQNLVNE